MGKALKSKAAKKAAAKNNAPSPVLASPPRQAAGMLVDTSSKKSRSNARESNFDAVERRLAVDGTVPSTNNNNNASSSSAAAAASSPSLRSRQGSRASAAPPQHAAAASLDAAPLHEHGERHRRRHHNNAGRDEPSHTRRGSVQTASAAPPQQHVEALHVSHHEPSHTRRSSSRTASAAPPLYAVAAPLQDKHGERHHRRHHAPERYHNSSSSSAAAAAAASRHSPKRNNNSSSSAAPLPQGSAKRRGRDEKKANGAPPPLNDAQLQAQRHEQRVAAALKASPPKALRQSAKDPIATRIAACATALEGVTPQRGDKNVELFVWACAANAANADQPWLIATMVSHPETLAGEVMEDCLLPPHAMVLYGVPSCTRLEDTVVPSRLLGKPLKAKFKALVHATDKERLPATPKQRFGSMLVRPGRFVQVDGQVREGTGRIANAGGEGAFGAIAVGYLELLERRTEAMRAFGAPWLSMDEVYTSCRKSGMLLETGRFGYIAAAETFAIVRTHVMRQAPSAYARAAEDSGTLLLELAVPRSEQRNSNNNINNNNNDDDETKRDVLHTIIVFVSKVPLADLHRPVAAVTLKGFCVTAKLDKYRLDRDARAQAHSSSVPALGNAATCCSNQLELKYWASHYPAKLHFAGGSAAGGLSASSSSTQRGSFAASSSAAPRAHSASSTYSSSSSSSSRSCSNSSTGSRSSSSGSSSSRSSSSRSSTRSD